MNLPSSFRREMESAEGFFAMTDEDGAEEEDEDGGAWDGIQNTLWMIEFGFNDWMEISFKFAHRPVIKYRPGAMRYRIFLTVYIIY